ncbi:hypothetical protein YYC_03425 [Plasmodium yoelii 17X]|uniref:valine--tRNA ligase n=1 Tax=Plasmodium yoelii 17X TaxID=1323249 RepID=V7PK67_PLAYE|nr:hypothetical protein YYC_03425 [Plasmodium yoelii 17X]
MFWKLFLKRKNVDYISESDYIIEMKRWQNEIKEDILRRLQSINIVINENEFYNTMDENMKNIVSKTFYILYKNKLILNKMYPVYYCSDLKTIIPRQDIEFCENTKEHNDKKYLIKLYLLNKEDINIEPDEATGEATGEAIGIQLENIYIIPKTRNIVKHLENDQKLKLNEDNVIYLELDNKNDIHNLTAILFYSINKDKFENKYAYIPSYKKIFPMIYSKKSYISPSEDSASQNGQEKGGEQLEKKVGEKDGKNVEKKVEKNVEKKVEKKERNKNIFVPVFSLERGDTKHVENFQYVEKNEMSGCAYYKGHKCKLVLSEHWYINYKKLSKIFCENNFNKNFVVLPRKYRTYFFENIINNDWILNRQIPYGHKIPIYKYECNEDSDKKNVITNKLGGNGDDDDVCDPNFEYYVYGNDVKEAYNNMIQSPIFKNKIIKIEKLKKTDVLDSWLSSALYFIHCLDQSKIDIYKLLMEKKYLVDLICTGKDILHSWIVKSFVLFYYLVKNNNIKDILSNKFKNSFKENDYNLAKIIKFHGLLKDNVGKKISKTDKNVKYYDKYLKKLNVDTIRLSFCFMQKEDTEDVIFSENYIKKSEKFLRKLWNIANFIKINCSYNLYNKIKIKFKLNTNEQIYNFLEKLNFPKIGHIGIYTSYCDTIYMSINKLKAYDTFQAINIIHNFIMIFFSKFYINYYLFNSTNEYMKQIGNFLLIYIFKGLLKILYPFIPHITEILYLQIYRKENIEFSKKQINENVFHPLSSNYNFFENENFLLKKSVVNSTDFDVFTKLFNYFCNLKKISKKMSKKNISEKNNFHIYIKNNNLLENSYFYKEVLFFHKLFDMNIFLYSSKKRVLPKNNNQDGKEKQTLLYTSKDFDILLVPEL